MGAIGRQAASAEQCRDLSSIIGPGAGWLGLRHRLAATSVPGIQSSCERTLLKKEDINQEGLQARPAAAAADVPLHTDVGRAAQHGQRVLFFDCTGWASSRSPDCRPAKNEVLRSRLLQRLPASAWLSEVPAASMSLASAAVFGHVAPATCALCRLVFGSGHTLVWS